MTVRVTLNCELAPKTQTPLNEFLSKNLPNVRTFSGCLNVAVYFEDVKSHMLIEEEWQSIEHHQRYISHIQNNGVLAQLAQFFTSPPNIRYFKKQDL